MTRSLCTGAGAGLPAPTLAALGAGRACFPAPDAATPSQGPPGRPIIDKLLSLFQLLKLICLST
jgi:hypothetical protein